jgi:hypothetical protein
VGTVSVSNEMIRNRVPIMRRTSAESTGPRKDHSWQVGVASITSNRPYHRLVMSVRSQKRLPEPAFPTAK